MKCKRLLCFGMAAALAFSSLPGITASAQEIWVQEASPKGARSGDWEYANDEWDEDEIEITGYKGTETAVKIPGEINGKKVVRIGEEAFMNCTSLTSVEIPDSVTEIGGHAFDSCTSLTSVEVPNSVKKIDGWAFSYCASLTSIKLPSELEQAYFGQGIFCGCESLTGVKIPNGVIQILDRVFKGCSELTWIVLPVSVVEIDDFNIRDDCKKLKHVYYAGTEEQMEKANQAQHLRDFLTICGITIHYNSTEPNPDDFKQETTDPVTPEQPGDTPQTPEQPGDTPQTPEQPGDTPQTPETPQKSDQDITVKNAYTKTYGDKTFSLNAKVNTNTTLTYASSDKKVATVDKNGKVTIKGCGITNITIIAPATDAYNQATKTVKLTVKPKKATLSSVKSTKKKTATVKWKKDTKASGYIIQLATDSKFKKNKVQMTVSKNKTVSSTVKKLKAGKKYYVRVCAYAKSGKTKVQGDWSKVKTVKVKK